MIKIKKDFFPRKVHEDFAGEVPDNYLLFGTSIFTLVIECVHGDIPICIYAYKGKLARVKKALAKGVTLPLFPLETALNSLEEELTEDELLKIIQAYFEPEYSYWEVGIRRSALGGVYVTLRDMEYPVSKLGDIVSLKRKLFPVEDPIFE